MDYDPKNYWEKRLSNSFNLQGVGHISFSPYYNSWLYRKKKLCIEAALREIPLESKDVLDIGCGTGFFVKWYLSKGANVCGVDITDVSIEKLKQLYKAEFITQDISSENFQVPGKFDVVNMWDVIYHIVEEAAFNRTLSNITKSLNSDGLFLFTDWFGASSDVRVAPHVQTRSLSTYQRMLGANFDFVSLHPLYNLLNKLHWPKFDNYFAPIYFLYDRLSNHIAEDNLSLAVWRKKPD